MPRHPASPLVSPPRPCRAPFRHPRRHLPAWVENSTQRGMPPCNMPRPLPALAPHTASRSAKQRDTPRANALRLRQPVAIFRSRQTRLPFSRCCHHIMSTVRNKDRRHACCYRQVVSRGHGFRKPSSSQPPLFYTSTNIIRAARRTTPPTWDD